MREVTPIHGPAKGHEVSVLDLHQPDSSLQSAHSGSLRRYSHDVVEDGRNSKLDSFDFAQVVILQLFGQRPRLIADVVLVPLAPLRTISY